MTKSESREGLRDIDELKAVFQGKLKSERNKAFSSSLLSSSSSPSFPASPPAPQVSFGTPSSTSTKLPGFNALSSYIDIRKTLELPPKEIEYIWRLRHASDPQSLSAVIPRSTYTHIEATARRHPQFILPLPRKGQGAEIHFLQWAFPAATTTTVLFTHLAEFKLRGEYAQPHTTITHHLDLADPKGLILLQGSVANGRGVTVDEGKWLLMCLQKFYAGEERQSRKKLLEQFSQGDSDFKVQALLDEAEKLI